MLIVSIYTVYCAIEIVLINYIALHYIIYTVEVEHYLGIIVADSVTAVRSQILPSRQLHIWVSNKIMFKY